MNTYEGAEYGSSQRLVVSLTPRSLTPWKRTAPESVWVLWSRCKFLPLAGNEFLLCSLAARGLDTTDSTPNRNE
jgi:hypothetical protein